MYFIWGNGLTACLPICSDQSCQNWCEMFTIQMFYPTRAVLLLFVCWYLYGIVYVMVSVLSSFSTYSIICHFTNQSLSLSLSLSLFSLSISLSLCVRVCVFQLLFQCHSLSLISIFLSLYLSLHLSFSLC